MRTNSGVTKSSGISVPFNEGKFSAVVQEGIKTPQVGTIFAQRKRLAHIRYVRRDATNLFYLKNLEFRKMHVQNVKVMLFISCKILSHSVEFRLKEKQGHFVGIIPCNICLRLNIYRSHNKPCINFTTSLIFHQPLQVLIVPTLSCAHYFQMERYLYAV